MNVTVPLKKIPILKLILVIRNKSAQDLANYLSTPQAKVYREQVSTWINARGEPTLEQAKGVAKYLNWDLEEIWEDEAAPVQRKHSKKRVGKQKLVTEDALKLSDPAPDAPANVVPIDRAALLDRKLRRYLIRSVDKNEDNTEPVLVYRTAAGRPDDPDTTPEPVIAYVPRTVRHIKGKARMFGFRVRGTSMLEAGIEDGDILFARQSSSRPPNGSIVIVHLAGEGLTCKRLKGRELLAESPVHEDIRMLDDDTFAAEVLAIFKP